MSTPAYNMPKKDECNIVPASQLMNSTNRSINFVPESAGEKLSDKEKFKLPTVSIQFTALVVPENSKLPQSIFSMPNPSP